MPYRSSKPLVLQRRHFECIARIIATLPNKTLRSNMAIQFSKALLETNPKFNKARFFEAATAGDHHVQE